MDEREWTDVSLLTYRPSEKHCEPITAQKPGTKCPRWSATRAQELLDQSEPMGEKRVATLHGIAFVAQYGNDGTWHGYPEAWDKIDGAIRARWLAEGRIQRRDLRRWAGRDDVRDAWKELNDAE
jgi:hypothetical protein